MLWFNSGIVVCVCASWEHTSASDLCLKIIIIKRIQLVRQWYVYVHRFVHYNMEKSIIYYNSSNSNNCLSHSNHYTFFHLSNLNSFTTNINNWTFCAHMNWKQYMHLTHFLIYYSVSIFNAKFVHCSFCFVMFGLMFLYHILEKHCTFYWSKLKFTTAFLASISIFNNLYKYK